MAQVMLFNVTNGLIIGAFYVLMALGLSLILNLSNVINFAHGNFLALGGIPVERHIWMSFSISCFFTALAGTLYLLNNFADPLTLHYSLSGYFVVMTVIGGMRTFWGRLLGAAVFVMLQDYISSMTVNWMSFVGVIFILVVLFFRAACSARSGGAPRRSAAARPI